MLAARPQKITFGEMREMGVRGVLVYCADYHCSHSMAMNADHWPDDVRLSNLEPRFVCRACGRLQLEQAADRCDGSPGRKSPASESMARVGVKVIHAQRPKAGTRRIRSLGG